MLNNEQLLIKIMELLDFDMKEIKLQQTSQKERFYTQEESNSKYREHVRLILKSLNLDKENKELIDIFLELLFLYNSMYSKLLPYSLIKGQEKKLNWIIIKRLVIPFLAYKFAQLDNTYNNRIDKNMPGGLFWYLPDMREYKNIKMPINYLMEWWLDLYGNNLSNLCDEIDNSSNEERAMSGSLNILKEWKTKDKLPKRSTLINYLNTTIEYLGIFNQDKSNSIDEEYERVIDFIKNKKDISIENLKNEIPENSLVNKIFIQKNNISQNDKKRFIQFISERWAIPSKDSLKTKFIVGRAIHKLYRNLVLYFNFKNSNDLEENKIIQLIYQYQALYNIQVRRCNEESNDFDILDIGYEMIAPFYTKNIDDIILTIFGDITIEFSNPDISGITLEDIYAIKIMLFSEHQDKRLKKSLSEIKTFNTYFHENFNNVDKEFKLYYNLNDSDFFIRLNNEKNFNVLQNIFQKYIENYSKLSKICLKMTEISQTIDEKQIALSCLLVINTLPIFEENNTKFIETTHLLNIYEKLLVENQTLDIKDDEVLMLKGYFYLKAKDFESSLFFFNEYFDKYIFNQKKEEQYIPLVYYSSYCSYIVKDKDKLKKYNKYIKKMNLNAFTSKKDLPFPICFYK